MLSCSRLLSFALAGACLGWLSSCDAVPEGSDGPPQQQAFCPAYPIPLCPLGQYLVLTPDTHGCDMPECATCPPVDVPMCPVDQHLEAAPTACREPVCVPDACPERDEGEEDPECPQHQVLSEPDRCGVRTCVDRCPPQTWPRDCPPDYHPENRQDADGCWRVRCEPCPEPEAYDCPPGTHLERLDNGDYCDTLQCVSHCPGFDLPACPVPDFVVDEFGCPSASCREGDVCPGEEEARYTSRDSNLCAEPPSCESHEADFHNGCGCGCRAAAKDECELGGCGKLTCAEDVEPLDPYDPEQCNGFIWLTEYECYKAYGTCERQTDGQCGWTINPDFVACVESIRRLTETLPQ